MEKDRWQRRGRLGYRIAETRGHPKSTFLRESRYLGKGVSGFNVDGLAKGGGYIEKGVINDASLKDMIVKKLLDFLGMFRLLTQIVDGMGANVMQGKAKQAAEIPSNNTNK